MDVKKIICKIRVEVRACAKLLHYESKKAAIDFRVYSGMPGEVCGRREGPA
jgi:hypothetical protein